MVGSAETPDIAASVRRTAVKALNLENMLAQSKTVRRLKEVQERPKAYGLEDLMVDSISRPFIPEYG